MFIGDSIVGIGLRPAFILLACFLLESRGEANPEVQTTDIMLSMNADPRSIVFNDGSSVRLTATPHTGFTLFHIASKDLKTSATYKCLVRLPVSSGARIDSTLNTVFHSDSALGLMSASPEIVVANPESARRADLKGCSHQFVQTTQSMERAHAARFSATCALPGKGWTMQGVTLNKALNRDAVTGLRAWVHGDGLGEQLKFQLTDKGGGARDYYQHINFTGWREVELTTAALEIVHGDAFTGLNLYYNEIPANSHVTCQVDDIRATVVENGTTKSILLEDFESPGSPWWSDRALILEWNVRLTEPGAAFAIISCSEKEYFPTVQRFERAGGIITPYPKGQWNKKSPVAQESYLFLTSFAENQFDEALALARRGGFRRVLLGQESWCQSTGHYQVKRAHFPDGLPGLIRTVKRFREAGIDVGLHLLGASIDLNDPYLTPIPDPRLVKDGFTTLTMDLDAVSTTVMVQAMSDSFPAQDGGYMGDGAVLQIGSELIKYEARTTTSPYTFTGCARGYLGSTPEMHPAGSPVSHLARSFGYHLFDMDTTLLDEVTSNFAVLANACDIGMLYFDGSERLQGEHGRYNARLINTYLSKLNNHDILVQASSYSHFTWHQLARTASADGHGDLKGYLEQRSPAFTTYRMSGMPLDIGWYYGYDTAATPDMYEYILGSTIGYESSFSYQVSVTAAKAHPFTGEILDLIKRYEELRLSGRVPASMRALLRVPDELEGKAPDAPDRLNAVRRDYQLIKAGEHDVFQRVIYGEWQSVEKPAEGMEWKVEVTSAPATLGIEIQALQDVPTGKLINPWVKVGSEKLQWTGEMTAGQYLMLRPGEPATLYGSPLTKPVVSDFIVPIMALPKGSHTIQSGCDENSKVPYRIRTTLQLPERHIIP